MRLLKTSWWAIPPKAKILVMESMVGHTVHESYQVFPEFKHYRPFERPIMHLTYENVNDAFHGICQGFHTGNFLRTDHRPPSTLDAISRQLGEVGLMENPPISRRETRYGEVLVIEEPVTITYTKPWQRVLFNQYRDANPFFHLIEALWTLAGRDDIESLLWFNSRVGEFSDNGKTWHGAYGKRWTDWCVPRKIGPVTHDEFIGDYRESDDDDTQLQQAIDILKSDRKSRRVVLQQWQSEDLTRVLEVPNCKDVPCNTEVMFLPRPVMEVNNEGKIVPVNITPVQLPNGQLVDATVTDYLDMTVINRSNDMLWGALGSNYVTFSFLHEYVAAAAGYKMGLYHHFTNNLHVYVNKLPNIQPPGQPHELWSGKWDPEKLIAEPVTLYPDTLWMGPGPNKEEFDEDLRILFEDRLYMEANISFNTLFMNHVVTPMLHAWGEYKEGNLPYALKECTSIQAPDWQLACQQWIERRIKRREEKHARQREDPKPVNKNA